MTQEQSKYMAGGAMAILAALTLIVVGFSLGEDSTCERVNALLMAAGQSSARDILAIGKTCRQGETTVAK